MIIQIKRKKKALLKLMKGTITIRIKITFMRFLSRLTEERKEREERGEREGKRRKGGKERNGKKKIQKMRPTTIKIGVFLFFKLSV